MKIIVDKLPEKPEECIFYRGSVFTESNDRAHHCKLLSESACIWDDKPCKFLEEYAQLYAQLASDRLFMQ